MSDADIKKLTAKFDVAKMEQAVEKAGTVEEAAKALNNQTIWNWFSGSI